MQVSAERGGTSIPPAGSLLQRAAGPEGAGQRSGRGVWASGKPPPVRVRARARVRVRDYVRILGLPQWEPAL